MAIKPILFNTEMVRAILDGRKDATRRIVKGFIPDDAVWGYTAFTPKGYISCRGTFADGYGEKFFKLPCEPGDILYVRETWKKAPNGYYYYEDWQRNDIADVTKWKPSIHMPKEAARIWLKVTDVRVERLQDITSEQIGREGVEVEYPHVLNGEEKRYAFSRLWDSTIKKSDLDRYGWNASPWVWVIEFERCEKPEGV
nr:MAG TPA: ASCH domain protein [Bacteriophage sp.]